MLNKIEGWSEKSGVLLVPLFSREREVGVKKFCKQAKSFDVQLFQEVFCLFLIAAKR